MSLRPVDNYFMKQPEPAKGCLLALRRHILQFDEHIAEDWKYGMPFYNYGQKRFCYLWTHKKLKQPYIGFVAGNKLNHPELLKEDRKKMAILLIDLETDLPLEKIDQLLSLSIGLLSKS